MMRVFVTGMGGEIGTRVARHLEADDKMDAIAGMELEPHRRMLLRAAYHYVDPLDRVKVAKVIHEFKPTVVVHMGIYEPHSRSTPEQAESRTEGGTAALLDACRSVGTVEHLAVRSGLEVYGRRRGSSECPDESAPVAPTTRFGTILAGVEAATREAGADIGASVFRLRCAPVTGAHLPSPLARYLRMPLVPVPLPPAKQFSLVHVDDVAHAMYVAATLGLEDTLNLVAEDTINVYQALRRGKRLPLPVLGPTLRLTRMITELLGSPLPDHTLELLTRGRMATSRRAHEVLGFTPQHSTSSIIDEIYDWSTKTYMGSEPTPTTA